MTNFDFFVDTSVLIDILEKHPHPKIVGITKFSLGVSVISEIELLGKKNITLHEINKSWSILKKCTIIDFSDAIKATTIALKQKYSLKIPDAVIAATAKNFNLPLITTDKDFIKIKDISVVFLDLNN
jgi:predicted nucleic acid-binding protein